MEFLRYLSVNKILTEQTVENWAFLFENEGGLDGFVRRAYDESYKTFVMLCQQMWATEDRMFLTEGARARTADAYVRALMAYRTVLWTYCGETASKLGQACLKESRENNLKLFRSLLNDRGLNYRRPDINGSFAMACDELRLPHDVRDLLKARMMEPGSY